MYVYNHILMFFYLSMHLTFRFSICSFSCPHKCFTGKCRIYCISFPLTWLGCCCCCWQRWKFNLLFNRRCGHCSPAFDLGQLHTKIKWNQSKNLAPDVAFLKSLSAWHIALTLNCLDFSELCPLNYDCFIFCIIDAWP